MVDNGCFIDVNFKYTKNECKANGSGIVTPTWTRNEGSISLG